MYSFFRPCEPSPILNPTLVASTTLFRLPLCANHLPRIVSDSPPWCPGTHAEYTFAVSIASNPRSTNASSNRNEVASSAVHPNTLPPNTNGTISRPDFPKARFCMKAPTASDGRRTACGSELKQRRSTRLVHPLAVVRILPLCIRVQVATALVEAHIPPLLLHVHGELLGRST